MTDQPPILSHKDAAAPSVFEPKALLREFRRQKGVTFEPVPKICILDPDGDLVSALRASGKARQLTAWPCYHTKLDVFDLGERSVGIVGCAVGAPFAVLVAEELFASGCEFLISLTSAGQITETATPPYFILIDKALRDEGTSYHYAAPSEFASADPYLIAQVSEALKEVHVRVFTGASWTTDAPFRETVAAIEAARAKGALAVEMEAAALYAFGAARGVRVVCLAHVTNTMGRSEHDFEKGEADGTKDALNVLLAVCSCSFCIAWDSK